MGANQVLLILLLALISTRTSANLQSWSVPQKSVPRPVAGLGSGYSGSPYLSPESGPIPEFAPAFGKSASQDQTCHDLIYPPSGEETNAKETQRGQLTLDILTCILKELRRQEDRIIGQIPPPPLNQGVDAIEDKFLPPNYNRLEVPVQREFGVSPNSTITPVQVDFFLNIHEVMDFSEIDHYLGFDVEIIAGWRDNSIAQYFQYSPEFSEGDVYLSGEFLDKIWKPDLFFEQIASSSNPNVGVVPKTIVLSPSTGYVKFKMRSLVNLYCDFDFFYYPADSQECIFTLRSYSYSTKLVNISWFDVGIYLHRTFDYNFEYQVVSAEKDQVPEKIGRWTNIEQTYATLKFVVRSRRKLSYHVVQTYVPSVLLALVTWLCFLVPREQSEVRVGVAMTTLLTITAMFSSVRASAPVVSYVKAIDCWMFGCIFFIFSTLAGFLGIAWAQKREKLAQIHATQRIGPTPTFHPGGYDSKDITELPHHNEFCPIHSQYKPDTPSPPSLSHTTLTTTLPTVTHSRPRPHSEDMGLVGGSSSSSGGGKISCSGCGAENMANKLDGVLMLAIPSCFGTFVVFYWIWLLVASGYNAWSLDERHNNVDG